MKGVSKFVLLIAVLIVIGFYFFKDQPFVVSEDEKIKKAVYESTQTNPKEQEVLVEEKTQKHAKGTIGGGAGGAVWYATNIDSKWKIIFTGQDIPPCATIDPYDFPSSMIPKCVDQEKGVEITREVLGGVSTLEEDSK